jgi:glycerate dehydrogenase
MQIVFLDRASLRAEIRRPSFSHNWIEFDNTAAEDVVTRLQDTEVVITNKVPLRENSISQLPNLKLIAVAATGVDILDLDACRRRQITVCNVRNYAPHSVPEHAITLMLALRRNLFNHRAAVDSGAWQRAEQFCLLDYPIHDLSGATLGIIGYGTLARGVETLASAFGMRVKIADRKGAVTIRPSRTPFENVLRTSDILSLHAPLTPETLGIIGEQELRMMKPGALLINTARGGLVDEAALAMALQQGVIGGAGIDVLSSEPPRLGNPLLDLNLPNLIVTPHVAWASNEAMQTLADILIDNIESFVAGHPQNVVA